MSLAPELEKISVDPGKLLLDPNNPRLFTQEEARVPLDQIQDPGVQDDTKAKIASADDKFKIAELVDSIETNGYMPELGGYLFVRKLTGSKYYLVLEGNRRLVAIRRLLEDSDRLQGEAPEIFRTLNPIDVLEIVDDIPEEEIEKKISYLLGTCHHGSRKDWSPFAQARGIFERYLKLTGQNDVTFRYETDKGSEVASLLSIKENEVKNRLTVYRAMRQLAALPEMKSEKNNGGIIDRYYTLISEAVCPKKDPIKKYIPKNPDTFALEDVAIERMINLCNFDGTRDRRYKDNSPPAMNNPNQWRYLSNILKIEDAEKREEMLLKVEIEHQHPEEVWSRWYVDVIRPTWKKWLEQVHSILSDVGIGEDFESDASRTAIIELYRIVGSLGEDSGGNHA